MVAEVAAADDETTFALHTALAARWATTSVEHTTREAGQAGVRLRCYLDLRQTLTPTDGAHSPWQTEPAPPLTHSSTTAEETAHLPAQPVRLKACG
ncbi:DUF6207 family protein [Streptomyces marokkonensis]|uniref:DUF6207 family protein n=1 Tax=Streptomyces marokkonensis TaxID=324855 RepID=A0ABW6QHK8_9ACTN